MPNLKQNVFIDDESSDLSSNRFGWLLDYSSFHGIHVVSSYLPRRGGAKIVIPNSIKLKKSHPFLIIRSVGHWRFGWLLSDTIVDWNFGHQDSWVGPVRSQFRAIVVRFLVLFSDVMFSYNSKMIFIICFLREDQIWWLGSKFDSAFWAALKYRFVLFSFNVTLIPLTYWISYNDNRN